MPLNPIKIGLSPVLHLVLGKFFNQNWSLFAPNPVAQDHILLIQPCLKGDRVQATTQWYNLSSPFWESFQKNRFSAYDRLARAQSNSVRSILAGSPNFIPLYKACKNGDSLACKDYEKALFGVRETSMDNVVKIASAFCNDVQSIQKKYTHVAIRLRVRSFPTWSKRYTEKPAIQDFDLGVYPIDKSIAPIGLFN